MWVYFIVITSQKILWHYYKIIINYSWFAPSTSKSIDWAAENIELNTIVGRPAPIEKKKRNRFMQMVLNFITLIFAKNRTDNFFTAFAISGHFFNVPAFSAEFKRTAVNLDLAGDFLLLTLIFFFFSLLLLIFQRWLRKKKSRGFRTYDAPVLPQS